MTYVVYSLLADEVVRSICVFVGHGKAGSFFMEDDGVVQRRDRQIIIAHIQDIWYLERKNER
jgi:hypothetical protein